MKMTIEVDSEDRNGVLMAYEALLPLALRWSPGEMVGVLVPKEKPLTEEEVKKLKGED